MGSQKKIEEYREILKRPYLELRETGYLFSGIIPKEFFLPFHPDFSMKFGIKGFSLPWEDLSKEFSLQAYDSILYRLLSAIQRREILAHSIKLDCVRWSGILVKKYPYLQEHTYLLLPTEAIAVAVTEGVILPEELQIASRIFQISESENSFSKGKVNEVKRDATAQAVRWKYSDEKTISGLETFSELNF